MDLLVVGGTGLLGREVVEQARRSGVRVAATFHRNAPAAGDVEWHALDIRHRDAVAALVGCLGPAVVVNAAYQQADWATTADGAMHVAAAAAAAGARLVHVSSDAVFSGRSGRYDETAPPVPGTPYGAAKAAAETAVRGLDPRAVIARTSLIVGERPARPQTVYFTDDIRCPVHVGDLASGLLELAASSHRGVHHLAGADAISRYELAVLLAGRDAASIRPGLRARSGLPGAPDVRLDCAMSQARLATRLRGAREFLASGSFPGRPGRPAGS
jgi:dTDP-4-dehydrorhamnose reductase